MLSSHLSCLKCGILVVQLLRFRGVCFQLIFFVTRGTGYIVNEATNLGRAATASWEKFVDDPMLVSPGSDKAAYLKVETLEGKSCICMNLMLRLQFKNFAEGDMVHSLWSSGFQVLWGLLRLPNPSPYQTTEGQNTKKKKIVQTVSSAGNFRFHF